MFVACLGASGQDATAACALDVVFVVWVVAGIAQHRAVLTATLH
jgi:hypothetical protein